MIYYRIESAEVAELTKKLEKAKMIYYRIESYSFC